MKPDWKDAPEWAKYLAVDGDGQWYWYQCQPVWDERMSRWYCGKYEKATATTTAKSCIEERPQ